VSDELAVGKTAEIDDLLIEGNETVNLTLQNPGGPTTLGATASTVTIVDDDGTPVSTVFIGQLWADAEALRMAKAWQDATDFHTRRPPLFG